jgi:glycosyltransferase involved in cell wall biosynthesis
MKIALITDAWAPQVNGVVRTLETLYQHIEKLGHEISVFHPGMFITIPCPSYPEIKLAPFSYRSLKKKLDKFKPDCIHISTEGPLGYYSYRYCRKNNYPYTTAFHTQFPEYIHQRIHLPTSWTYSVLKKFHNNSSGTLVATESVRKLLQEKGFEKIKRWTRGIDMEAFHPHPDHVLNFPQPIQLYVGRVAVEKNLDAFLTLDTVGTKVIVGDGPALANLKDKYPQVHFLGKKMGEELTKIYSSADVFVFPSLTDTFGLVMLEALACGTPVAAFPIQGPIDVITNQKAGCLDQDLKKAIETALKLNPQDCINHASSFSWENCGELFLNNLALIKRSKN